MSFVSYAQNFEDVMLWRALKHVEKGFYVDIGAQDPTVDSVSLVFYEHGWRGVHVEPTQQYSELLRLARPDEQVFQVAIGLSEDMMTFYEFKDTGLSTADWEIALRHEQAGFRCNQTLVPVMTLDTIFECIGVQDIHWLKLDVEGLEKVVLESWTGDSFLPWVLIIESTRPHSQEESFNEWEYLILSKGYKYVYFDGLNRFYLSPKHFGLARAFGSPPNIFDGFVLSGTASQPFCKLVERRAQEAESKAQEAESKAQEAQSKAQEAETKAQEAETKAQEAETKAQQSWAKAEQAFTKADEYHAQLMSVYSSTFWRITKPLRWTLDHLRGLRTPHVQGRLNRIVRAALLLLIKIMSSQPKLKQLAIVVATRFGISGKLRRLYWVSKAVPIGVHYGFPMTQDFRQLSPRARHIYAELKQAFKHRREDVH